MTTRAKANTALALLLVTVITIGACTREVQLPALYPAPGFTLTNQDGLEAKLSDFRGKVVIINFFYTRCADVCGEVHSKLRDIWEQLEEGLKQDLVLISISFDLYDTPEVLKQYATFYDVPGWQFLTGTEEQIHQVTSDYGVGYEMETAGADQAVEFTHNISLVFIDRHGMVRKTYGDPDFPEKAMIRELTYLLNQ